MEVVGGLLVAEQIISTGLSGGAAVSYALSKKTLPLRAKYACVGTLSSSENEEISPDSLARSGHTLNVIDGDAFIFGGHVSAEELAGNEVHILKLSNLGGLGSKYKVVPALASKGELVPAARTGHTACPINDSMVVFGGFGTATENEPLNEEGKVWIFNPKTLHWTNLDTPSSLYPTRGDHAAVAHGDKLIVHGGYTRRGSVPENDTWSFDLSTKEWTQLPSIGNSSDSPALLDRIPNLACVNDKLYRVTGSSDGGSQVHVLDLAAEPPATEWSTLIFPTNPLTASPQPRKGAGLLPVKTGLGRTYLVLMLGEQDQPNRTDPSEAKGDDGQSSQKEYWSNMWALQLPSTEKTPAHAKDAAREQTGMGSHEAEWAEIVVEPQVEDVLERGKSHPGPRGYFGCDNASGHQLVLWGGINPKDEMQGDGWIVELGT